MTPRPPLRPALRRRGLAVTALALAASAAAVGVVAAEPLASSPIGGTPASGSSPPGALASDSALTAGSGMGSASATPAWAVPAAQPVTGSTVVASALVAPGMPGAAFAAYRHAQDLLARTYASCHLSWTLLAGIGTVESSNGQYGGSVLDRNGVDRPPVIGIRLDGSVPGTAVVRDTDHGRWDGDPVYDHAVGPMQFLPATWAAYGVSAAAGQPPDPENINDAALTAGTYLCDTGNDLSSTSGQRAAVLRYNDSQGYADTVIALANAYAAGLVNPVAVTPPGLAAITTPKGETTGAARSTTEAATTRTAPAAQAVTTAPAAAPSTTSTASAGSATTTATPTPTPTSTTSSTATSTTSSTAAQATIPLPTTTSSPTTTATAAPAGSGATAASTPATTDPTTGTPTDSPTSPTTSTTPSTTTPSTSTSPAPTATTPPAWVPEGARLVQPTPGHVVLVWPAASTALPPAGAMATLEVLDAYGWVAVSSLTVPTTATEALSWTVTQGSVRVAVTWDGAAFVSDSVIAG